MHGFYTENKPILKFLDVSLRLASPPHPEPAQSPPPALGLFLHCSAVTRVSHPSPWSQSVAVTGTSPVTSPLLTPSFHVSIHSRHLKEMVVCTIL